MLKQQYYYFLCLFCFCKVFGTLNKMGFSQAEKCVHIPYNMVSVPEGKMGSRLGNVILFNELRKNLGQALNESYIDSLDFPEEEKDIIRHACSVGSIRYGMLFFYCSFFFCKNPIVKKKKM